MKRGGARGWIWIGALVIAAGGGWLAWSRLSSRQQRVQYRDAEVSRGKISQTILSTGVVQAYNRLDIKAPVPGRVEKILVAEGQRVRRGQVLALMSSTERAALLDAAKSKGDKEVAYWEDAERPTPLLAPENGLVILKNLDRGQTVGTTDIILSMADRLIVKAQVDETDLADVKLDQRAELVLDAFPKEHLPAKVLHIAYDSKTVNNVTTYEVDVVPEKVPAFMKSGMTANVAFILAERDQALLVPAGAVKRHGEKSFVLVPAAKPGDPPISKPVDIGISDGKMVEVVSGVGEGDKLLLPYLSPRKMAGDTSSPFSPFPNRNRSKQ